MRNPERWRNLALAGFLVGLVLGYAAFALPEGSAGDGARGVMFGIALLGTIFAGPATLICHQALKRKRRLASGEGVMARWRIPAADWRAFLALDSERNARGDRERNEFIPREEVPAQGVDITVGEDAIEIDGSQHSLPRHAAPEVLRFEFDESRVGPSVIEFDLKYPGTGTTASGNLQPPRFSLLRFPVPEGAQREARAIVAHFGQMGPGRETFFHGRGDGSDPEDLTTCWKCGFQTHRFVSGCERCGATMVSKRWARRYGVILILCGLFISVMMSFVLSWTLPALLHPGEEAGGTSFTGSPAMAKFVLLILGTVLVFGLTALGYGIFQVATGRRSRAAAKVMLAIASGMLFLGTAIGSGFF
jgi:hypothetical protein